jgi:hypothetical protein
MAAPRVPAPSANRMSRGGSSKLTAFCTSEGSQFTLQESEIESKSSRLWLASVLHSKSGVEADLSQLGGSCVNATTRQIAAACMHRRQLCSAQPVDEA